MTLKIFGQRVKVYRQKGLSTYSDAVGYFDLDKKRIVIDADLKGHEYEVTLLHEILESIWDRGSFSQSVNNDLKEVIIDQISKCLVENFKFKQR